MPARSVPRTNPNGSMVLVRGVVDGEVGRPHGAGVRPHGRGLDVFCEGRGTVVEAAVLSVVSSFDPHVEGDIVGMEATDRRSS